MAIIEEEFYTTNEQDQKAVAQLQNRISKANANSSDTLEAQAPSDWKPVPSVSIDEGQWKYVLISATEPFPTEDGSDECSTAFFVTSKRGANYHQNAAEPYVDLLQSRGYRNIHVSGGGRINLNSEEKSIRIFGFSYGFGLGDHSASKSVIERDDRYKGYTITWSNDGY